MATRMGDTLSALRRFDPAALGFDLSNREWAALIYLGAALIGLVIWPTGRRHLIDLAKIFFGAKLSAVFAAMTAYVVAIVAALWALHAWAPTNLKTTLVWWLTVGFASVFQTQKIAEQPGAFRKLIVEAVAWTEVVVFLAEVHSLPLLGELVLLPFLTLVACLLVVAQSRKDSQILVGPLTGFQIYAGLGILVFSLIGIVKDPKDFLTRNTLREFADPILLSLAFIPFLYGLALVMTTEQRFTMLRIQGADPRLAGYAQRRALLSFGIDFEGARRLARDIRLRDIEDRAGVDAAIREIKALQRRERHPPSVDRQDGWSPYAAQVALKAHGVVTDDYHRAFDSWWAQAPSVKLGDEPLPPRVSYYIGGTEHAVTRLRLHLDINFEADTTAVEAIYRQMCATLLTWALGGDIAAEVLPLVLDDENRTLSFAVGQVRLERNAWGVGKLGGYGRDLTIVHPAHVEGVDD